MIRTAIVVGVITMWGAASGQNRQEAFDMNQRLGRGINMGDMFEAPTETAWGNPWKPSYFKMIAQLGFTHVRVPVRWETPERSMSSAPYTITATFLDRIQEVVDSALRYKLHVIINMHHHDTLFAHPAGEKERFLSQWYQIADRFKDYPDSLLFEVLNEPHGNLTADMWNDYFAGALTEIRKTNPDRFVLMGVADYGGTGSISKLVLPDDGRIMLTIHYYNPFTFTHQGAEWVSGTDAWLGTTWNDTEADRESVESEFNYAIQFSETNDIPIHIGEFGAYSKADMASRKRWTTFLARWFEEHNMSWAYWEFSAGFGIYNPTTHEYVPELVDALLHNEMPEPTPVVATPVYTSDFTNDTNGWSLVVQGGAAGSLSVASNRANISIASGGTEPWHVQLARYNIPLQKGKVYRLSFTGRAHADRSITFYAGKASDPWNAYSSYNSVALSTEDATYSFIFTMTSPTDPASRLVFDLGVNTSAVEISSVKVEQLSFPVTSAQSDVDEQKPSLYPNPVSSYLWIDAVKNYDTADVFDLTGKLRATFKIDGVITKCDATEIPSGMYVLSLKGSKNSVRMKFLKE